MNELSTQIINEYFDANNIGLWKRELEDGVTVRLFADNNMLELLGAPKNLTPEECCEFFMKHIYPEDMYLMAEYDQELLNGMAEVVYRYNHPTQGLIYVRCGGRMTKKIGNKVTFVGYHKELSDTIHVENGEEITGNLMRRSRELQLQESQAYYRRLMDHINCGIVEYTLESNAIQYSNAEMLKIFGVKSIEEFQENIHDFVKNTTYEDPSVTKVLRKLLTEDGGVDFEGTITRLDGQTRNIIAHIETVTSLHGERSAFTTFLDITENRALKANKHIFDTLCKDYLTFFFIDFKKKKVITLKKNQRIREIDRQNLYEADFEMYDRNLRDYYEKYVDKESAADYVNKLSLGTLKKQLETISTFTYRFNTNDEVDKHYFEVFVAKAEGIEDAAVMGYRLIDDIIVEEEEKKKQLEKEHHILMEQNKIIHGLSKDYTTVWFVSENGESSIKYQDTGMGKNVRDDDFFSNNDKSYEEGMKEYIERFVCDEDKEQFARKTKYEVVLKAIHSQPIYSIVFGRYFRNKKYYFQVSFALTDPNGMNNDFVMGFKYVDDVVMAERQKNEELAIALKKAEVANIAKTQFLNNMSHDIRTPMNALLGYTNIMKNEKDPAKIASYQEKIEQSGKLLLSIINNVLDMAHIESGKIKLDENCVKTGGTAKEIVEVFESEAEKKGIKITYNGSFESKYVMCDETKLREIYINLISNAIKYTLPGGKIAVKIRELPCEKEGYVRIQSEVIDTGIGMSKEFLKRIYEPFSRERNTTIGKVGGTGLGMPIVKKYLDMMGASIKVKSELGKGTHYTILFEHKLADKAYYEQMNSEPSDIDIKEQIKGKRILLAEDNELNAEIAINILEDMGLVIDRVEDGIQCVDKVETMPAGSYDLILMDIQMPNMDGYKATQVIRFFKDEEKSKIPIVAMTANAFEEDRRKAFEIGMNGHIAKPISIDNIKKTLAPLLKNK